MEHRSAQLTSLAVELALRAAEGSTKPIAVAGVLGSDMVSPIAATRLHEELSEHSARLLAAGCELVITRGQGSRLNLMAAVVAAAKTDLMTWAVIEHAGHGQPGPDDELFRALRDAGAQAVLFEVPTVALGLKELDRTRDALEDADLRAGVLLAASESAIFGFPDVASTADAWADHALDLDLSGARVIGGGAGTTEEHLRALARALGSLHPSMPAHRSDTEIDIEPRHTPTNR
jgi:5-methyltetrahydrofolate--homocysteine methyltransferase